MASFWPLPALGAWALSWATFLGLVAVHARVWPALLAATGLGTLLALLSRRRWRRVLVALGFPLSLFASGLAGAVPPWAWLLPLALLLALYPLNAWRDAPVFPTPRGALDGLAAKLPLPASARIVDAGCGCGDGLRELQAQYPNARIDGWEWSWPLTLLCRLRLRGLPVKVERVDIWKADWSQHDLVYLFQRPESMARALRKAEAEMRPGSWVASLEFEAIGWAPAVVHRCPDGRPVWLYRLNS